MIPKKGRSSSMDLMFENSTYSGSEVKLVMLDRSPFSLPQQLEKTFFMQILQLAKRISKSLSDRLRYTTSFIAISKKISILTSESEEVNFQGDRSSALPLRGH